MTDPLGQSQVIPYLQGLCREKRKFWLMSFEKKSRFQANGAQIQKLLDEAGIVWIPLLYTPSPPVLSTLYDLFRMRRTAFQLIRKEKIHLLHCRSYISALVGLSAKRKFGTRFLFDMRGFWADERVDGGIWKLKNPLFKGIYKFFKRMEMVFLKEADAIVSLTGNAKAEIQSWPGFSNLEIDVIPCCADLNLFSRKRYNNEALDKIRIQAGISGNRFVVSYLGSVGTWYMLPEMLLLFKVILEQRPDAVFLFITPDEPGIIRDAAAKILPELPHDNIVVKSATRMEVPLWASISDVSVFFIRPMYSKKASSPTKMGELMGLGIPLICNSGVGDVEEILNQCGNGLIIRSFEEESLRKSLNHLPELLAKDPMLTIQCAHGVYALEEGVRRYEKIYRRWDHS